MVDGILPCRELPLSKHSSNPEKINPKQSGKVPCNPLADKCMNRNDDRFRNGLMVPLRLDKDSRSRNHSLESLPMLSGILPLIRFSPRLKTSSSDNSPIDGGMTPRSWLPLNCIFTNEFNPTRISVGISPWRLALAKSNLINLLILGERKSTNFPPIPGFPSKQIP